MEAEGNTREPWVFSEEANLRLSLVQGNEARETKEGGLKHDIVSLTTRDNDAVRRAPHTSVLYLKPRVSFRLFHSVDEKAT